MKNWFLMLVALLCASTAWSAVTIDANISADRTTAAATIQSPTFSTVSGNELLLAFVATDYLSGTNTVVSGVAGGGLSWQLVVRANGQAGTSEVWRAFAPSPLVNASVTATLSHSVISSITVVSLTGVDSSGVAGAGAIGATANRSATSGAPTATLQTTRNGSLVFGVGNDYDRAVARTPGANQVLIHQDFTPTGDTYWVQMLNNPVALAGTSITLNDTAPTQDRYNFAIAEVLAQPAVVSGFNVTGTIAPASLGQGTAVALSQNGSSVATVSADAGGNFTFSGIANGSYTLTPTKPGVIFNPPFQAITVNGADTSVAGFSASAQTWSISGSLSPALGGAVINLSGASTATTNCDASGSFSFSGLAAGTYTITPSNPGYLFTPPSQTVNLTGNLANVNFNDAQTWTVSGNVGTSTAGVNVNLGGSSSANTKTDSTGNYSFAGLLNGSYTLTPSQPGLSFTPASLSITVNGADLSGENFTAQNIPSTGLALDVNVSNDSPGSVSVISTPSFSTKSQAELLLAFVATDYLSGSNTTVTSMSGGGLSWSLVRRTNSQRGSSEIWAAFSNNQLSSSIVSATLSQKVVATISLLSFSGVDVSGVGGILGVGATASGSAASGAPSVTLTTTRAGSMIFAVGNDYDNAISRTPAGKQSVLHQYLTPTGDTYWLQRLDGTTTASGTAVQISDSAPTGDRYNFTAVEILPAGTGVAVPPPAVTLISPAANTTIAGLSTLAATASSQGDTITQVAFLVDGVNVGTSTSSPYFLTWDSTKVAAGAHTFTAVASDSTGQSTTSAPVSVTVDNSGNPAIVGSWSSPVGLNAVAVNLILLKNGKLLFYDDGATPSVWDYNSNTFSAVPTNPDLFCSGHASLADGRILVVGGYGDGTGSIGIANSEIFDPSSNAWIPTPNMSYKRWYPTATTLSDGRILVTAGWQTSNHTNAGIPEIYDPATNSYSKLTNANNPFETYPFIFMLSDGRILHVGGSEYATNTDALDLTSQTWSVVDDRLIDGGSATMYLPDKIMKAGSATDSQNTGPSSNTTFVLDMSQSSPKWQQTPSMTYARSFLNLTELPDGTVLATGGESDKNGGNISNAVYTSELWSPATQTWSTMSAMHTPREYHSTALLLPDGRVIESGMGADFGSVPDQRTAEFFSPPYLFKGSRPAITQAPSQIHYNEAFGITTPDAANIKSAVLIRLGAVTHFFDQNTRYIPLSLQVGSGTLTLTAPVDGKSAPPGYYMLFIVNSSGVPSIAPIVQVGP